MIRHRIKPIEAFDAVSMNTPLIYDAPTDCLQANNLRRLGVFHRSLDIDFQGIEAKINIADSGVNHRDCAVMFRPCYAVAGERLVIDGFFVGAATAQDGGCGENKEKYGSEEAYHKAAYSLVASKDGQALFAKSRWP